jgi:hypothetical protein
MPALNSYSLLTELQTFLHERDVDADRLTAEPMVALMIDWFRLVPIDRLERAASADALVYRYGGWSEGCATGFRFSVLRRITEHRTGADTDWYAGITLLFEPSRYADLSPFDTVSSDWKSIDAFLHAIESSAAFKALSAATPMSVLLESGGLR